MKIQAAAALLVALVSLVQAQPGGRSAAIVNGEPIAQAELDRIASFILKEKFTLTPATAAQQQQIRQEVMGMLIDDALLRQFLDKNAPPVGPAEVQKEFARFVEDQTKNGQKIEDFYRQSGQTEQDIRTDLHTMLQWTAYAQKQVKDEDLKRYYNANKDFFDQVTVRASHILKQLSPGSSESDKRAARDRLKQVREEIVLGKIDFAEAAKRESQCQVSAATGGDIGYFPRKFMWADSFAQPAFALKVGEVSDVVETPYGLHLIKVTDRKVGRASEFEKVKEEVREFYVEELRQDTLAKERAKAKVEFKAP